MTYGCPRIVAALTLHTHVITLTLHARLAALTLHTHMASLTCTVYVRGTHNMAALSIARTYSYPHMHGVCTVQLVVSRVGRAERFLPYEAWD